MSKKSKKPNTFRGSVDLGSLNINSNANNISKIEIMRAGSWDHPVYGEFEIDEKRLVRFKENFDKGVRKAIPIDIEHKTDEGAVGWVNELSIEDNRLFATIEWTNEGIKLIKNKKYRFFSPEFADEYEDSVSSVEYRDVLIGGAITNRPFFQELDEVVVLSNKFLITKKLSNKKKKTGGENKMKKSELKKKLLSDPKFIPSDKDKVSFEVFAEVKKEVDVELAKKNKKSRKRTKVAKEPTNKTVSLSEHQFSALEKAANEGVKAMRQLRTKRMSETIETFVYSESNKDGVLLPKSKEIAEKLMFSLNKKQRGKLENLLGSLPKISFFAEKGVDILDGEDEAAPAGTDEYSHQLATRATALQASSPKKYKSFMEAALVAEKQLAKEGIMPDTGN